MQCSGWPMICWATGNGCLQYSRMNPCRWSPQRPRHVTSRLRGKTGVGASSSRFTIDRTSSRLFLLLPFFQLLIPPFVYSATCSRHPASQSRTWLRALMGKMMNPFKVALHSTLLLRSPGLCIEWHYMVFFKQH